jgi:hypothetical protein
MPVHHDCYQQRLTPDSALFDRRARKRLLKEREHAVEPLSKPSSNGQPRANGKAQQPKLADDKRSALRLAILKVEEAQSSLDAAKTAHAKQEDAWRAQRRLIAAAETLVEDADAVHTQWLIDNSLGQAQGDEPPTREEAQAKLKAVEAAKDKLRQVANHLETEIKQRENAIYFAKLKAEQARGELLKSAMAELVACYEAHMKQARLLRQHALALSRVANVSMGAAGLSGFDQKHDPPDTTAALRSAVAALATDADADLSAITAVCGSRQ